MIHRYSAVLFDLDDTLIDFKKSESISLRKCYAKFFRHLVSWEAFYDHYMTINRALWHRAETGEVSTAVIGSMRFHQVAELYRIPFIPEIVQFYEEQLILNSHWIDGAEEVLEALKTRSVPVAFITNGFTHLQRDKQKKLRLYRFSQYMIVSEECGFAKPHPKIFLQALDLIKAEPSNTLMIGDSLTSDGIGAKNVQMPFCWYNPHCLPNPHDWQPDMVISTLKELTASLP